MRNDLKSRNRNNEGAFLPETSMPLKKENNQPTQPQTTTTTIQPAGQQRTNLFALNSNEVNSKCNTFI